MNVEFGVRVFEGVVLPQALVEGPGLELLDGEEAGAVGCVEVLGGPLKTQPPGALCQQLPMGREIITIII